MAPKNNFNQGDYVHIPSEVKMFLYEDGQKTGGTSGFKRVITLKKPQKLMFISSPHPDLCEVFYEGGLWTVQKCHVYKTGESK